jgi:hypothetical protein
MLPLPRPGTVDGQYEGTTTSRLGEARCRLSLRATVFELACISPGWQSAESEYRDGAVQVSGTSLTLSSNRSYLKQGDKALILNRTPITLGATIGKGADGTDTITGNFGAELMVLLRH